MVHLGSRGQWFVGAFTLLVLGMVLAIGHRWGPSREDALRQAAQAPRLGPAPTTIVPGVHLLGGLFPAAAYAVQTSDGLVLIDSGLEPDAAPVKRDLSALGLDWRQLRAILLTHVHGDHSGGARYLRAQTGAKVYAGQADAAVLRAGGPREAFFSTFLLSDAVATPTPVDVELTGDEVLDFGEAHFHVLASPGHTPGSLCYLMERDGLRVLFGGDVIMSLAGDERAPGRLARPLGTYAAYLPPRYRGDARAFLATLHRLQELPAPDLVLPGHPRMDAMPQRPALSPARWHMILTDGIRDMEALVTHYDRDGANFLDGAPRELLPGLYYLGDRGGAAVYAFRAGERLVLVDAPGEPGLGRFVAERLRSLGVNPVVPNVVLLTDCGPRSTAGLRKLVEETHVSVVAAAAGLDRVKELCPVGAVVLSAEELARKNWFPVQVVPLGGRGLAPTAYQVEWAGKSVLFAGGMPVEPEEEPMEALRRDLAGAGGDVTAYRAALARLANLRPKLWLPAVPSHGQNANLYDDDWRSILADNRRWVR